MRRFLLILTVLILLAAGIFIVFVLTLDEERAKQLIYAQVEARTGQELTVAGELKWRLFPALALEAGEIRLSNPPGMEGPDMVEAETLRASVRLLPLLKREIRIGDVAVEGATIRLLTDRSGRSNLDPLLEGEPAEPGAPPSDLSTGNVSLRNVILDIRDETLGTEDRYRIDSLQLDPFAFDRPVAFDFRGAFGEPPILGDLRTSGRLRVPSDLQGAQVSGLDVSGLLAGALEVNLTGELELAMTPLSLELSEGELAVGGQSFSLSFGYEGSPPFVRAELQGELLDLDRLLEKLPASGERTAAASDDHALAFLRHMDVDASLLLDRLIVSGFTVSNVDAAAAGRRGVLVIEPLTGALAGGRLDARAEIDLRPAQPRVRVEPRFELSDIGEALAPWGMQERLSGGGHLSLDLSTRSLDPATMLEQLAGEGSYELSDGAFHGLNFGALAGAIQERDLMLAAGEAVGGQTPFNLLAGRIQVGDGVVTLPDISLQADEYGLDGEMSVSLSDLGLDGRLRMDRTRLSRVPLKLDGTLTSPELGIAAGDLIREEGERRVQDWLQDRLRKELEPEAEPES